MTANIIYLYKILQKYKARNINLQFPAILRLKSILKTWANGCYIDIIDSGSRAKGTAISLASDVDFLISLTSDCNENSGGLKSIYDSLYSTLSATYQNVRKQNVSIRINLNGLEVDITPARKQPGFTYDHWLYVSKLDTRKQTNIQKHISDISQSGRKNEIKILKIWRELNKIDFPSIYLEYLIVNNILLYYPKDVNSLDPNTWRVFQELAKDVGNPLFDRIVDPANSNNILSDLLTVAEKNKIIEQAKIAADQIGWSSIVW